MMLNKPVIKAGRICNMRNGLRFTNPYLRKRLKRLRLFLLLKIMAHI